MKGPYAPYPSSDRPKTVDTVIMNPPFGTKGNKGVDIVFLRYAVDMADVVYVVHKTAVRKRLGKVAKRWGCPMELVAREALSPWALVLQLTRAYRWPLRLRNAFHSPGHVQIPRPGQDGL